MGIDYKMGPKSRRSKFWLRFSNLTYCVDRKGAGYDFETEPQTERAFEICIFRSSVGTEPCVS
jgi:hypothetical protein